jgi:Tfp pilus assembly protein PilN
MLPVHFLEELANSIPEDIWFAEISLKGASVSIKGEARTFEAVKRFYDNLQERPRWFKNVNYPGGSRAGVRVSFTISFDLLSPA